MRPCVWLTIATLALVGCVQNEYDLELAPRNDSVRRTLKVRRYASKPAEEVEADVARLAKEYGVKPPVANNQQTFRGDFRTRMPGDIGGYGTYTRWESPFGSVAAWVERFRGNDDAAGLMQRRIEAANQLADLLIRWLEREMIGHPRWPAFETFLDQQFRRDLINVGIVLGRARPNDKEDAVAAVGVNVVQYLVEHEYVTPEEIPEIMRAAADVERDDFRRGLEWLNRLITARMRDQSEPLPNWEFLQTREKLTASLSAFLETTDEYERLLEEWQETLKTDAEAQKPEPLIVITEILMRMLAGAIQLGGDQFTVALKTDRAPFLTNGEWSAESKSTRWDKQALPTEEMSPTLLYAFWDEPEIEAQKRHFGITVLEGNSLQQYCLWYRGLTEAERQEWDAFVATLRPDMDLPAKLKGFRFRQEDAGVADERSLAELAVDAILPALKKRGSDAE